MSGIFKVGKESDRLVGEVKAGLELIPFSHCEFPTMQEAGVGKAASSIDH